MEQSVSGKSHGRSFKRLSQRFFLPYGALKKVQLSGRKRPTSGVFWATDQSQAEHGHNSQLSKQETMADKSLGKVPVERLIVLITEHVEIYNMSNRRFSLDT